MDTLTLAASGKNHNRRLNFALHILAIAIPVMATVQPAVADTIAATATYTIYHTSNHETCDNLQGAYYTYSTLPIPWPVIKLHFRVIAIRAGY